MARVVCIGVGTVGCGWATVFARAGHEVVLYDADPAMIASRALPRIDATLEQLAHEMPTGETTETIRARIQVADTLAEAVAGAEVIQESVREDLDIKRALFAEIGASAPADCRLFSSTSALPGSQFLSDIPNPGRAMVGHPVNPPSHIPLVELCATPLTTPETVEYAHAFYDKAGMEPITVEKEIDGFILNRLQYTLVAEAMHLVGEGYCSAADIDRVMTSGLALRWASIGPFMTAHLNAHEGFVGFVAQLEGMMKKMGADARTDYDWGPDLVSRIHDEMARIRPVEDIAAAQAWRDRRILATRRLQAGETPTDA
ncbi:MAG TPA: 3-hydroxybutyryl-CoA dehydrogenase [Maritimibacter sp.]|nr:3-hydroxybutyryl-CoA dehydrogenase [Maritimibacter sp.]